jgi:hypothetical protein
MKKLTIILSLVVSLTLVLPAWAIEKEKKGQPSSSQEQKPPVAEVEKRRVAAPKEIAPPRQEKPEVAPSERKSEESKPVERQEVKPPLERKFIQEVDKFVDKNGNGIDDRLEGQLIQVEKPKPPQKKKKKD